jgi:hypothetical protein
MDRFHIFRECRTYFFVLLLHYWTVSAFMVTMSITIDVSWCYYYGFHIITKSGLYEFLSKFQGMSGMAMGWDVNFGIVNGCTMFVRYVVINSNFHFFV